MTEFETSLELLIALGVCQISARPNDERLQRALEVVTRYLELGATRPTISSQQLAVLRAWMVRQTPGGRRNDPPRILPVIRRAAGHLAVRSGIGHCP